jgi:hypothetical protein
MWPVTTAFDDSANPSNGVPHNPQASLALAPREAFFDTVLRFGPPSILLPRGLGGGIREIKISLLSLLIVSV